MKEELIKELIKLYKQYLLDSIKERTVEWTDLENGGKKPIELKGDFDGFMEWLETSTR